MIGKMLGDYQIIRELGRGGMGIVYLAEHQRLRTKYAIKVLPEGVKKDDLFIKRFHLEASVMAHLSHSNIVKVVNMGRKEDIYYIVMEYIADDDGQTHTLDDLIADAGLFLGIDIKGILLQVCDGLIYSHNYRDEYITKGVIHRDLKPENIFIRNGKEVKISDFGLVRIVGGEYITSKIHESISISLGGGTLDGEKTFGDVEKRDDLVEDTLSGKRTVDKTPAYKKTSTGALLGTYDFMSPEQKSGKEADQRSDIYALGILIYKLLTGKVPSGAFKYPSEINKKIPKRWDEVVRKCLQEEPKDRYQSVKQLREVISQISVKVRKEFLIVVGASVLILCLFFYLWFNYLRKSYSTNETISQGPRVTVEEHKEPEKTPQPKPTPTLTPKPTPTPVELLEESPESTVKPQEKQTPVSDISQDMTTALNRPPELVATIDKEEIQEGEMVSIKYDVRDPEGKDVRVEYSIDNGNWIVVKDKELKFRGIGGGKHNITLRVKDEEGNTVSKKLSLVVKLLNRDYVEDFEGINIDIAFIPAGSFQMGSNYGNSDESPIHLVALDSYWIGKYEITTEQYCKFLNEVGDPYKKYIKINEFSTIILTEDKYIPKNGCSKKPVNMVSWYGANEFCKWLYGKTGKVYSLPSEAQWEYAARGGLKGQKYPWGNESPEGRANYGKNWISLESSLIDIGNYKPNGYGLFDVAGNVYEWCSDYYAEDYYSKSEAKKRNPINLTKPKLSSTLEGSYLVKSYNVKPEIPYILRGGSWFSNVENCRVSARYKNTSDICNYVVGFRIVRIR